MNNSGPLNEEEEIMDKTLLTVGGAAKILDRSTASVRIYEAQGKLPVIRTATGLRLFRVKDVQEFAQKYLRGEAGALVSHPAAKSPEPIRRKAKSDERT
jgi:hypothetical protein